MQKGIIFLIIALLVVGCQRPINYSKRSSQPFGKCHSLNGKWLVAEGNWNDFPQKFDHQITLPGLIKSAQPAFKETGVKSSLRDAFWFKKEFTIAEDIPESALLKIYKAKYGTKVYLNGNEIGESHFNFTSQLFDIKSHLKGNNEKNTLLIRVGAHISDCEPDVCTGGDVEKEKYYPGIYDDIEIILSGSTRIANAQIVPNLAEGKIDIDIDIDALTKCRKNLDIIVFDISTKQIVNQKTITTELIEGANSRWTEIEIPDYKTWSPDAPHLYQLQIIQDDYKWVSTFGMRDFKFDPSTGFAKLNDETIFMRGTNICLQRFFEDSLCKQQPWDTLWVAKLIQKCKEMNWNAIRPTIGAVPEFWYDIFNREGILIFDEYPVWYIGLGKTKADVLKDGVLPHEKRAHAYWPENLNAEGLINELSEWMKMHWNHPSVVVWDANNETWNNQLGIAIDSVRKLDYSNRPWDNGWSPPRANTDMRESHQYFFGFNKNKAKEPFDLSHLTNSPKIPKTFYMPYQHHYLDGELNGHWENPVVINEYGYLWLNRDGTPTTLTKPYYDNVLGSDASAGERRYHYARNLAALTEYWRSTRTCAGVLHFSVLSYSRSNGQTSDNFIDVDSLQFEPNFLKYVKPSFSPLGICINKWDKVWPPNAKSLAVNHKNLNDIPVIITNDTNKQQHGTLDIDIYSDQELIYSKQVLFQVAPLNQITKYIKTEIPQEKGSYTIVATIQSSEFNDIKSYRDFTVK